MINDITLLGHLRLHDSLMTPQKLLVVILVKPISIRTVKSLRSSGTALYAVIGIVLIDLW